MAALTWTAAFVVGMIVILTVVMGTQVQTLHTIATIVAMLSGR